jgi:hypothetical protein
VTPRRPVDSGRGRHRAESGDQLSGIRHGGVILVPCRGVYAISMMNDRRKIGARDRRCAAVHEAGHAVVARHFGCEIVSAWIVPADNPGPDEKTWIGRIQIMQAPADPLARRMIGVAGEVAEYLWFGGSIEDFYPDVMSKSDWRLSGCEPDEPDDLLIDAAAEVGRLLSRETPHWQALIAEIRHLIVQSR